MMVCSPLLLASRPRTPLRVFCIAAFEFLARLRDNPEHDAVPVIVWTMKDLTSDDHRRLHEVAQAVLLKGYDRNVSLTEQMRSLLKRSMNADHGGIL